MDREADILKDRIEVATFKGRRIDAREGVGCGEDEEQERRANQTLHRQDIGTQRCRQIRTEPRHQSPEKGENQNPEQHRALVVSPNPGDLVEDRLH